MQVTGDKIREALKTAPFQPFQLHLADQRKVDLFHPEFAWVLPNRRHVLVVSLTTVPGSPGAAQAA